MVEKFGYSGVRSHATVLDKLRLQLVFAERIGVLIHRIGERRALTIEYIGLIFVFVAYGLVDDATMAAVLYVIDHMFFAMAIAISTYFQKIADPKDMASTAGVSFTISHIAAIVIPAALGLVDVSAGPGVLYRSGFALLSLSPAAQLDLFRSGPRGKKRFCPRPASVLLHRR